MDLPDSGSAEVLKLRMSRKSQVVFWNELVGRDGAKKPF